MVVNLVFAEGYIFLAVQGVRGFYACAVNIALVQFHANSTGNSLLGFVYEAIQSLTQGAEPHAIINQFRVADGYLLLEGLGCTVQAQVFQIIVAVVDDCASGVFINATGFHAYQTVFNHIGDTNSIANADFIQFFYQFSGAQFFAVYRNGNAFHIFQFNIFRFIRSLFRNIGYDEQLILRCIPGIFQIGAFMGQMPHVAVHGVVMVMGYRNGNVVSSSVVDFLVTRTQLPFTPRSNNSQIRVQSFYRQLETNLVITLAGSTVSDSVSAFSFSDFNKFFSDQRTSEGSTQQVFLFINSASLNSGPYIILNEFFLQIQDIAFASTGFDSLVMYGFQLIALAQVSTSSDNLAAIVVFLQPRNDYGCIKATGVSQNYFFNVFFFHCK